MKRHIIMLVLVMVLIVGQSPAAAYGYTRPAGADMVHQLKSRYPSNQHPRLILTPDKLAQLKETTDPQLSLWIPSLINRATSLAEQVTTDPLVYDPAGILSVSRKAVGRIPTLALAYAITEREDFLAAAVTDMLTACAFSNWNPSHFLDTAEMAAAVALGFDWCYNGLKPSEKITIKNALRDKALKPAYEAYIRTTGGHNRYTWHLSRNNWNAVCNGGIALAALAIADESDIIGVSGDSLGVNLPEQCLERGLISLENMLPSLAPDGVWEEGVVYWEYMMKYYAWYMAALESATGSNYGYINAPGVEQTGYFSDYVFLQTGTFNFADSGVRTLVQLPELLYFGKAFNNSDFLGLRYRQLSPARVGKNGGVFDILLYNADTYTIELSAMPQDKLLKGNTQLAVMRGENNAVALKGGAANTAHGHHDIGSFVFDARGVRWALDLSGETYYSDYFGSARYLYYRTRMEGHNTLVLNPSPTDSIVPSSNTNLSLKSGASASYAVADMTSALATWVTSAKRGLMLYNDKKDLLIQDELTVKTPNTDSWWFMHTDAEAISLKENGKAALLQKSGRYLYAKILSAPADAVFTVRPAEPLMDTGKKAGIDSTNNGVKKLSINGSLTGTQTIAVALISIDGPYETPASYPTIQPISQWRVGGYDMETVTAGAEALIDGKVDTAWETKGFSQAIVDLGEEKTVSKVSVYWGNKSGYEFNIHTSTDGVVWGFPFRAGNSKVKNNFEHYEANPTQARYVRLTVNGHLEGDDCNVYEIVVE